MEKSSHPSDYVAKSKAKTKIRKISTYTEDAKPDAKAIETIENSGFTSMTDFDSVAETVSKNADKETVPQTKISELSVPEKKSISQSKAPKIEKPAKPVNMVYKSISKHKLKSIEKNIEVFYCVRKYKPS